MGIWKWSAWVCNINPSESTGPARLQDRCKMTSPGSWVHVR